MLPMLNISPDIAEFGVYSSAMAVINWLYVVPPMQYSSDHLDDRLPVVRSLIFSLGALHVSLRETVIEDTFLPVVAFPSPRLSVEV